MSNKGSGLLAFVAGSLLGAAFGILYAPEKGKNTRDKLNYQLDKFAEKLQVIIEDLMQGKMEVTNEAKSEGEKLINDAIKEAEKLKNEVDALRNRISTKEPQ